MATAGGQAESSRSPSHFPLPPPPSFLQRAEILRSSHLRPRLPFSAHSAATTIPCCFCCCLDLDCSCCPCYLLLAAFDSTIRSQLASHGVMTQGLGLLAKAEFSSVRPFRSICVRSSRVPGILLLLVLLAPGPTTSSSSVPPARLSKPALFDPSGGSCHLPEFSLFWCWAGSLLPGKLCRLFP